MQPQNRQARDNAGSGRKRRRANVENDHQVVQIGMNQPYALTPLKVSNPYLFYISRYSDFCPICYQRPRTGPMSLRLPQFPYDNDLNCRNFQLISAPPALPLLLPRPPSPPPPLPPTPPPQQLDVGVPSQQRLLTPPQSLSPSRPLSPSSPSSGWDAEWDLNNLSQQQPESPTSQWDMEWEIPYNQQLLSSSFGSDPSGQQPRLPSSSSVIYHAAGSSQWQQMLSSSSSSPGMNQYWLSSTWSVTNYAVDSSPQHQPSLQYVARMSQQQGSADEPIDMTISRRIPEESPAESRKFRHSKNSAFHRYIRRSSSPGNCTSNNFRAAKK